MFVAMDAQFWIYIVIIAIYGLSRLLKKPEEKPQRPARRPQHSGGPQSEIPKPKPLTFEELLREITEAKQPQRSEPKPVVATPPATQYSRPSMPAEVDYDDDLGEEEQDLETIELDRKVERTNIAYEDAKRQAFARPSLEETLKLRDTDVRFEKFKVFEEDTQRNLLAEYTRDLKDPEGLKKAFVLTEILNRKF